MNKEAYLVHIKRPVMATTIVTTAKTQQKMKSLPAMINCFKTLAGRVALDQTEVMVKLPKKVEKRIKSWATLL